MKVQNFAYNVAVRTMDLLEQEQHYKIPDETRKEITQQIMKDLHRLLQQS